MPITDLSNKVFGRLTVIGPEGKIKGRLAWACLCACGRRVTVRGHSLTSGNTRSCGCRLKEIQQRTRLKAGVAALRRVYRRYKDGAKQRGHEFNLTEGEFFTVASLNCEYCGGRPYPAFTEEQVKNENLVETCFMNGIDRKDNKLGYTLDNVVPCCKTCNLGKHTLPYLEFIAYLDRICLHRGRYAAA